MANITSHFRFKKNDTSKALKISLLLNLVYNTCILSIFSNCCHKLVMLCHFNTILFITVVLTSLRQRLTSIIVIIIIVIFDLPLCLSDFVDKRGSKVKNTSKEDLEKFYSLSDESEEGAFMFHKLHYRTLKLITGTCVSSLLNALALHQHTVSLV